MMKKEIAPDLGFIGYPPIEPAWVMAKFLEKNRVPSVLDVKDAWPDVMLRSFPIKLRALARFLLFPYFALMKSTFKKCSHLSSISPEFLDWALAISGREAGALDRVNYLASFPPRLKESEVLAAAIFWDSLGVVDDREFRCSYIGSLTSALNLKKVFEAAKQTNFQFVIAGDGSAAKQFKEEAAFFPNIIFPGWITNAQASVLAKRSTVMIAPYKDLEDFNISLPNKFLDAVLLAKPILSSISGFAKVFIEKNNIGRFFSNDVSNSLADLICELSEDAPAIYEMSENAKKIFERELNGDIVYSKLVVHLEEIVKKWNQKEDRNGWGSGERPS
jgi:glycosyltransferase involved in cell wall biosynthesis